MRVAEHTNTAFVLSFAYDYAVNHDLTELEQLIATRVKAYFYADKNCPISWEPSGYDFISPCLEEIGLMQRVPPQKEFLVWLAEFMPQLADKDFAHSYPNLIGDSYEGGQWLGSSAIQALNQSQAQ